MTNPTIGLEVPLLEFALFPSAIGIIIAVAVTALFVAALTPLVVSRLGAVGLSLLLASSILALGLAKL